MTFEIFRWRFYAGKNYNKYCILLKTSFEIPLFIIKKVCQQISILTTVLQICFTYFPHNLEMKPYVVVTFAANSLVSFFN